MNLLEPVGNIGSQN